MGGPACHAPYKSTTWTMYTTARVFVRSFCPPVGSIFRWSQTKVLLSRNARSRSIVQSFKARVYVQVLPDKTTERIRTTSEAQHAWLTLRGSTILAYPPIRLQNGAKTSNYSKFRESPDHAHKTQCMFEPPCRSRWTSSLAPLINWLIYPHKSRLINRRRGKIYAEGAKLGRRMGPTRFHHWNCSAKLLPSTSKKRN